MTNRGVQPLDPTTPVGQLRLNLGDTAFVELAPPAPGFAAYANYSDDALEAFLAAAGNNVLRATGNAYMQLAAIYAAQGKSIRTDDLSVDTKGRGADLLAVAKSYFDQASSAEATEGLDFFDVATPYTRINVDPFYDCCEVC